ncbi:MAG: translation initiation factor IF-3 [Candidatus Saccharicenans sp.]|nr:translation initiation factor IF-3 [Candidatus Saccharicenans sp.]MDI6848180.1 translation initiation factor IF-3 [Candidatus Saccharicenans sp.]
MYHREPYRPAKSKEKPHRINEMIRVPEIRVIDEDKNQLGVMPVQQALALAREKGLDLVEIAPQASPPVCRIMDYGKFLYELHKKEHEAKKHQKQVQIKEIKFRPKISIHDYNFKLKHVRRFIEEGNKVKITIMIRGRERAHPEMAQQIMDRVLSDVSDIARQDGEVKMHDWASTVLIVPIRTGGKDAKTKNQQSSQKEVQDNSQQKGAAQKSQQEPHSD